MLEGLSPIQYRAMKRQRQPWRTVDPRFTALLSAITYLPPLSAQLTDADKTAVAEFLFRRLYGGPQDVQADV